MQACYSGLEIEVVAHHSPQQSRGLEQLKEANYIYI